MVDKGYIRPMISDDILKNLEKSMNNNRLNFTFPYPSVKVFKVTNSIFEISIFLPNRELNFHGSAPDALTIVDGGLYEFDGVSTGIIEADIISFGEWYDIPDEQAKKLYELFHLDILLRSIPDKFLGKAMRFNLYDFEGFVSNLDWQKIYDII